MVPQCQAHSDFYAIAPADASPGQEDHFTESLATQHTFPQLPAQLQNDYSAS